MLNFNSLLVFSQDPKALAGFYEKVFGAKPGWSGGDFVGFSVGTGFFTIGSHDKIHGKSKEPARIMFNFETEDVQGEFKRIKKLGAKVIAEPYHPREDGDSDMLIATFADPDGNYFQLMSPMDM